MRVRRKIVVFGVLIALLLPCLAFLEFLELTTFHDDPSNACILQADSGRSSVIANGHVAIKAATQIQSFTPIFNSWHQKISPPEFTSTRAPQDFLALFSLRRT